VALAGALNGLNITNADSTTGFNNTTITAAEAWTVEVVHQGNAAIGFQASSKDGMGYFTYGTPLNFNTTYLGQHLFIWVNVTMPGTVEALASGGLYIIVGSSSTAYKKFLVAAKDYKEVMEKGFIRFVLDPSKTATETVGSPDMTAIDTFGVWIDTDESARTDQLFIDRIDVGWGIEVTGTSTDFWNDLVAEDVGLNGSIRDNMFGIVQKYNDVFFVYGQIKIGDDSGSLITQVSDSDKTIKFVSQQYYNGSAWVDMVADDFFKIELVDNATNPTQFTDGIAVGSDTGRAGSSIAGSLLHDTELDFKTNLTNAASFVKLYSTQIKGMRGGFLFHNDGDSVFYGGVVSKSGQFDPGIGIMRNLTIAETTDIDAALSWNENINIQKTTFIANTLGAAVEMPSAAGTPYDFSALFFSGNTNDVLNSSGSAIDINKLANSDPSSYEGSAVAFLNTVGLTISAPVSLVGAEVRIYDLDNSPAGSLGTELSGVESHSAATYIYSGTGGNLIWIQIMLDGYVEFGQSFTMPSSDGDFTALLRADLNS